jgi:hypothetical protein
MTGTPFSAPNTSPVAPKKELMPGAAVLSKDQIEHRPKHDDTTLLLDSSHTINHATIVGAIFSRLHRLLQHKNHGGWQSEVGPALCSSGIL